MAFHLHQKEQFPRVELLALQAIIAQLEAKNLIHAQ
jgi:hypothetical protein